LKGRPRETKDAIYLNQKSKMDYETYLQEQQGNKN
jgi:hypothetical protein